MYIKHLLYYVMHTNKKIKWIVCVCFYSQHSYYVLANCVVWTCNGVGELLKCWVCDQHRSKHVTISYLKTTVEHTCGISKPCLHVCEYARASVYTFAVRIYSIEMFYWADAAQYYKRLHSISIFWRLALNTHAFFSAWTKPSEMIHIIFKQVLLLW